MTDFVSLRSQFCRRERGLSRSAACEMDFVHTEGVKPLLYKTRSPLTAPRSPIKQYFIARRACCGFRGICLFLLESDA